jgi:hypothetical protein
MSNSNILKCNRVFINPGNEYPVTTQLTSSISSVQNNDFTINVDDATNFTKSGYVFIGSEKFYYSSKTSTTLLNVFRGLDNTSISEHVNGSDVNQINNPINKLIKDDKLSGWYIDGYSNQASLRVQDSPVIQPGVIRYLEDIDNPSNSKFQGCVAFTSSGPVWNEFNALQGVKGDNGDINEILNFTNLISDSDNGTYNDLNSGAIIKSINGVDVGDENHEVEVRRLISGTRTINFESKSTIDFESNDNYIVVNPIQHPYTENLLSPISTLKGNDNNKCYGETTKVYIKPGNTINKGQITRYSTYTHNNNIYIVVEPFTYTINNNISSLTSKYSSSGSSVEIAGVALETLTSNIGDSDLTSILICTKGICQIRITSNNTELTSTTEISYIGKPCIMNNDGYSYSLASSEKPDINFVELGGFLEINNNDNDIAQPNSYIFINLNPKLIEPLIT